MANKVEKLALIAGDTSGDLIVDIPPHVYRNDRHLSPEEVIDKLSQSKVGLILSEYEGACYSSSEYLLCGLPVVSTYSGGGRSYWFNDYNSIVCPPDADAIAESVKKLASYNRDPVRIRESHIQQAKRLRRNFISLHSSILSECNDPNSASDWYSDNYQHKLLRSEKPDFDVIFNN